MITLLWFDSLGMLCSFFVHLSLLFGLSLPAGKIAAGLNIGIGVALGVRLLLTKELRQGQDWFFTKGLNDICPRWLKIIATVIIIYGIVNCVIYFVKTISILSPTMTSSLIPSRILFISVFSLIMACYTLEFVHVYSYRLLTKQKQKLSMSGMLIR